MGSATEPTPDPVEVPLTPAQQTDEAVKEIALDAEDSATDASAPPVEGEKAAEGDKGDAPSQDSTKAEEALATAAGFTVADIAAEFAENNGTISDETSTKLAAALATLPGFEDADSARGLVNQFFEGRKAQQDAIQTDLYSSVGGQAAYDQIADWAIATLPLKERQAHDRTLDNAAKANDAQGMKDALQSLKAKYEQHVGTTSRTVVGEAPKPRVVRPITSIEELARIQATPQYDTDPHFRDAVDVRVQAAKDKGAFRY